MKYDLSVWLFRSLMTLLRLKLDVGCICVRWLGNSLRSLILLNEFDKFLYNHVICLFWSTMIRPRQIIQLNYFSNFKILCFVKYLELSSYEVLHQTFTWNQHQFNLLLIFFEWKAFTNFRGPILITLNFPMLLSFCQVDNQSWIFF